MDEMEQKLLFGLTLETSQKIRDEIEQGLKKVFPDILSVCRYRKEGVYQYLSQQEEAIVVIEENLQSGNPYTTKEIQQLTDLGGHRIIFLMDRSHQGDGYVKELYCCGVYDGLYHEQVRAKEVLKLIFGGRTCRQARDYYGIQNLRDAERKNGVINEEVLGSYLEFVENGNSRIEVDARYRFATECLGKDENRMLAVSVSKTIAEFLKGNEIYQFYKGYKEKRQIFPKILGKKKTVEPEPIFPTNQSAGLNAEGSVKMALCTETVETEGSKQEEDMLVVLERFRTVADGDGNDLFYQPEEDLREILGDYLKGIDA